MKPIKTGNIALQLDTKICEGMGIRTCDDAYFAWFLVWLEYPDLRQSIIKIRDFHEMGGAFIARLNVIA